MVPRQQLVSEEKRSNVPTYVACVIIGVLLAVIVQMVFVSTKPEATLVDGPQPGAVVIDELRIMATPTRGPVPTPVGVHRIQKVGSVLRMVSTVSRLETKEYSVETGVIGQRDSFFRVGPVQIGGETIQAHIVGTVVGRTDLSSMTIDPQFESGSIIISPDGTRIDVVLPPPTMIVVVDEQQSSFNNHELGWWATEDTALWTAVRVNGTAYLREIACERDIRDETRSEAERQMSALLLLGFEQVNVTTAPYTTMCGV